MQDRQNHELPEQSALTDENNVSAQETTLAMRRKSVGTAEPIPVAWGCGISRQKMVVTSLEANRISGREGSAACARHRVDRRLSGALSRELLRSQMAIKLKKALPPVWQERPFARAFEFTGRSISRVFGAQMQAPRTDEARSTCPDQRYS